MLGFKVWKVQGNCMAPVYKNGSAVLVTNWLKCFAIKEGQHLLINHEKYGYIVKKVAVVDHNGLIWCKGENSHSLSIEQLGPVSKAQVIGHILYKYKPEHELCT